MVLLPAEHLIRFFPVQGTPVERWSRARAADPRDPRRQRRPAAGRRPVLLDPRSGRRARVRAPSRRRARARRGTLEIVMRVYFEKPRTTVAGRA